MYWVGMKKDVEEMVTTCDVCQHNKYMAMVSGGLLQPLDLPAKVLEDVTMDL